MYKDYQGTTNKDLSWAYYIVPRLYRYQNNKKVPYGSNDGYPWITQDKKYKGISGNSILNKNTSNYQKNCHSISFDISGGINTVNTAIISIYNLSRLHYSTVARHEIFRTHIKTSRNTLELGIIEELTVMLSYKDRKGNFTFQVSACMPPQDYPTSKTTFQCSTFLEYGKTILNRNIIIKPTKSDNVKRTVASVLDDALKQTNTGIKLDTTGSLYPYLQCEIKHDYSVYNTSINDLLAEIAPDSCPIVDMEKGTMCLFSNSNNNIYDQTKQEDQNKIQQEVKRIKQLKNVVNHKYYEDRFEILEIPHYIQAGIVGFKIILDPTIKLGEVIELIGSTVYKGEQKSIIKEYWSTKYIVQNFRHVGKFSQTTQSSGYTEIIAVLQNNLFSDV